MAEFRWILLGLGLLLIVGIWWWNGRRSSQAPGNAELRESTIIDPVRSEAASPDIGSPLDMHDWGRSPFEPLSIKTGDFEDVPILDEAMMADAGPRVRELVIPDHADTLPNTDTGPVSPPVLTKVVPPPSGMLPSGMPPSTTNDSTDRFAAGAPRKPNASEKQKIISVRVCAAAETRWLGGELLAAFESNGLAHGRYQVFHRRHIDGTSIFSVASLVEPGTFDLTHMATQEFKGVTLFAVLPGPIDPLLTIDEMLAAARGLAGELPGIVQDSKGVALSAQGLAELREDVAQFHATLPVS